MDVNEAILARRSIRKWKQVVVEREKIIQVLEAGRLAPSWANIQPWKFVVLQDPELIQTAARFTGGKMVVKTAPAVIVACSQLSAFIKESQRQSLAELIRCGALAWSKDDLEYALENPFQAPHTQGLQYMQSKAGEQLMIAMAYMTLEAVSLRLGTCWVGTISDEFRHVIGVPDDYSLHSLLALGYPDENPAQRPRKAFDDIVSWEKFS